MTNRTLFLLLFIMLSVSALYSQPDSTNRRYINLPRPTANLPFSDGVLVGTTLYLSGRLGLDPQSGKAPTSVDEEVRNIFDGLSKALQEARMTMDDLVYVEVFCTDLTLYAQFNTIYRSYFAKNFPARAFIGANALLFGAHFEVKAIAVK